MPKNKAIIYLSSQVITVQQECAKINSAIKRPSMFQVSFRGRPKTSKILKVYQKCLILSIFTIMCIFMISLILWVGEIYSSTNIQIDQLHKNKRRENYLHKIQTISKDNGFKTIFRRSAPLNSIFYLRLKAEVFDVFFKFH